MENYFEITNVVVSYFEKMPYGEVVTYNELQNLIPFKRNTMQFSYVISKSKKKLIEKGITLKTLVKVGYKVLNPEEVAEYISEKLSKEINKMGTYQKIMCNTEIKSMTNKQRLEHDLVTKAVTNSKEEISRNVIITSMKVRQVRGAK